VTDKAALRREARLRLQALPAAERARMGVEVARRVWTLPELAGARTLLLYSSLPGEVPTPAIAREAWRRGIAVTYPRCLPETRELALHRVGEPGRLRPGAYGIHEPDAGCPLAGVEEIDVALIPGLAWDRAGHRLGRGAGYYDRLLAHPRWRALRCGLFLSAQELPALPADDWDVRLDRVVTEREILNFRF
jgi:5-formyltetrahydrofolate cyclo-ligase